MRILKTSIFPLNLFTLLHVSAMNPKKNEILLNYVFFCLNCLYVCRFLVSFATQIVGYTNRFVWDRLL